MAYMEDPVILLRCELSLGRVWLRIMILTFLLFSFLCPDGSHSVLDISMKVGSAGCR